jgi:thiol-disulfide isomerase/thioredoxin
MRRWRRHALELALVLVVFAGIQAYNSAGAARGDAPRLEGLSTAGGMAALPVDSPKGTIVHFWATWCGICELMDTSVSALAEDHQVVTVALKSGGPATVRDHLSAADLGFTAIIDDGGLHADRWGVRGVPTTFFITPEGTIESVTVGYTSWLGMRIRLWLAGLG